jgi:hypothetical protein
VQIEPPELEMRVAILKKKAETERINLGDDVAFLIAKNLRSNVRELEGALKKVVAFAHFQGRELNMDIAKEALKDVIGAHNRQITLELIQKTVSDYFKIKVSEMFSQKRTRPLPGPARWPCGLRANSRRTACRKSATPSAAATIPRSCMHAVPLRTCAPRTASSTTTSTCCCKP